MHSRVAALTLLVALTSLPAAAERSLLTGVLTDAETGDTLAAGILRVLGTAQGTAVNAAGRYALTLEPGSYTLVFSSLGYRADTVAVSIAGPRTLNVALRPGDIVLPEILISSEDPAIEIIRRAIASRRRWIERLSTYEMQAFTRQVLWRDTSIASINESYSRGYWERGDTLREVILQRRQTENVKSQFNAAAVGRILNFSEDRVRFVGYSFVGPTADDALEYYDYTLTRTRETSEGEIYEITMIPRTRTAPLFAGVITIAGGTYALVGVDISPNEAFLIPLVTIQKLRYRQDFSLYDGGYWMPVDIRIDGSFRIGIPGISLPPISFQQTSVIYDYAINVPIPDSAMAKPRLTVDSAATTYDSTFWAATQVLPLSPREEAAYATLDSTQTLDVQFRPGGLAATLSLGDGVASFLDYLDLSFNRVEGVHAGVRFESDDVVPWADVRAGAAYGFSSKRATWNAGATLYPTNDRTFGLGADVYSIVDHRPDMGYYGTLYNSLSALLVRNDYRDYFRSDGWRAHAVVSPASWLKGWLWYADDRHRSVEQRTNAGLFGGTYRQNPPVWDGTLRAWGVDVRVGDEPVPLELVWRDGLTAAVEIGRLDTSGGRVAFARYHAAAGYAIPTFGRSYLFSPVLRLKFAGGFTTGTAPPQRTFDLESSSSGFGPFGVLRGARVKEFSGTSYVALAAEHNFRTIPFLWLGVPFLYENGVELILSGAAASSWNSGPLPLLTTDGWYGEAGIGLARLFQLLRVDVTWRLTEPRRVVLTLGTSGIF